MLSKLEQYHSMVAVAAIDALGIKALLDRDDEASSAMHTLSILVKNAASRDFYDLPSFDGTATPMFQFDNYFGDSIYLFSNPEIPLSSQVQRLAAKCASLLSVGLFIPSKFLARAAIGTGNLRIFRVDTAIGIREIRIGTAMSKAHQLQEAQEWFGGSIIADVLYPSDDINAFEYEVPLKNCLHLERVLAINWVGVMINNGYTSSQVEQLLRDAFNAIGSIGNRESTKLQNALEFIRYVAAREHLIRPQGSLV